MRFFDTHAHYDDRRFEEEFPGGSEGAIQMAQSAGVERIMNVGSSLRHSLSSIDLAERYDFIYAAVGIHPCDAQEIPAGEADRTLAEIEKLAAHKKVRAIGEIGFDYHYDGTDKACQTYFLEAQFEIAKRCSLPVIIHSRDAAGDTFDIIRQHPEIHGVLHSFSGSTETARQLSAMGWYVSFSGPVTYKNANKVKEAAAAVDWDKLLIETDCPYLPPVPHRGEINYSGYLPFTCAAVAAVRGVSVEETAEATYQNACRFYHLV